MFKTLIDFFSPEGKKKKEKPAPGAESQTENPKTGDDKKKGDEPLSVQLIIDEVDAHFRADLKNKSTKRIVSFPMALTVFLNSHDFNGFRDYFPVIAKGIVYDLYDIIKEEMKDGRRCENIGDYWRINFLPCDEIPVEMDGKLISLKPNGYLIASAGLTKEVSQKGEGGDGCSTVLTSTGGSRVYGNVNINRKALENIEIVGDGAFNIRWDPKMEKADLHGHSPKQNVEGVVGKLYAQGKVFPMTKGTFMISGNDETSTDPNIFRLDSNFIENGHVHIQYMEKENKFKMAAFDDVEVDGNPMPISTATDKKWCDLLNGMSISFADVVVTFKTV